MIVETPSLTDQEFEDILERHRIAMNIIHKRRCIPPQLAWRTLAFVVLGKEALVHD